jgi:glycerol-3-phosphate dehydrogenase
VLELAAIGRLAHAHCEGFAGDWRAAVHAVRKEMALTLADAVLRRTPLGALGHPGSDAIEAAAAIVGGELGWSDQRRQDEIAAVNAFYATTAL